jgi:hypothetical protein
VAALLVVGVAAVPAAAQERTTGVPSPEAAAEEAPDPTLATRRLEGVVEVDGRLEEEAWSRAPAADDFVQGDPVEGAEPAQPTEVRVLFDAEAVYVGARMHEPDPAAVARQLVRRDQRGQYDHFEVLFDPNLDRQTGYLFRVGASGVERDAYLFDDTREDVNWDAVWSSAVHRDSTGWSVEMRIPLSQIRYESRRTPQTWGVNFARRRLASSSVSYFSLVSRTVQGTVSQSGRLTGVRLTDTERRFQVRPFVATELATGPAGNGNPFFDGSEMDPRLGLDVQYGIGSAFSLDATFNPDFGQVEVDPAVVNLSAFETFFPEKRPFFVQDARIFDFDLAGRRSRLFFSRRIGRTPVEEGPAEAAFLDVPRRTTILGAAKFTGRTSGGLSVGALAAVTQEETGRAVTDEGGTVRSFVAQPAERHGVARVQQDFRDGASRVGAIVTGLSRDLPGDGSLTTLPSSAFSAGVDFLHQWGGERNRRWSLSGYVAGTHVRGSPAAMVELQTNPQHYYQRPDADRLSVDSAATHMTGIDWNLELARQSGEHWTWDVSLEQLSPDFAVNDMGFYDQGEQLDLTGGVTYREIEPGSLFRNWRVRVFTFHELRNEVLDDPFSPDQIAHAYKDGRFFLNSRFEFVNNWALEMGLEVGPRSLSDTGTRGGPLMAEPADMGGDVRLRTDRRKTVSLGPSLGYTRRSSGAGHRLDAGLGITVRPAPSFELNVEPTITFEEDAAQYVATSGAVPYAPTFGDRHVFAELERTELSIETRLNATFSPTLSLQLFLQPLVSSADFVSYRQLARAESYDFLPLPEGTAEEGDGSLVCRGGATCRSGDTRYVDFDGDGVPDDSFDRQDFNLRSLRGNAVLRWEYLPGSTLFLVWQQDRREEVDVGDFDLGRDLDGLLGVDAENTFIVKVSHYLDL